MLYDFHTIPYEHQGRGFIRSADAPFFAYTMEQRTGKTHLALNVGAYQYAQQNIDLMCVIAPNGVHRNWTNEEAPIHLSPETNWRGFYWGKMNPGTKAFDANAQSLLDHRGLLLITVNIEAISTEPFKRFFRPFLEKRRTYTAIDESSIIKTPDIPRSRTALAIGQRSKIRRILDGTPDAENPLELYMQYYFLSPSIFGFTSFFAFRNRYAVMERVSVPDLSKKPVFDPITKREVQPRREINKVKTYQHLEELKAKRDPFTFRVLRSQVFDMPPKVYQKRWYDPSDEQKRVYEELRATFRAEVRRGLDINGSSVLVRYIRYQQVLANFVPGTAFILCPACAGGGCHQCDEGGVVASKEPPKPLDMNHHPRLDALRIELEANPSLPTITWACFDHEIDEIMKLMRDLGRRAVRYDGKVSDDDKERAKLAFKAGDANDFVGKATSGGRGLTLSRAKLLIYYDNYFALRPRLQSEDRAEAGDKTESTGIVDILAESWGDFPTIDEHKIRALRNKQSLSAMVNDDPARDWL